MSDRYFPEWNRVIYSEGKQQLGKQSGFTLFELMVAVGLTGILLTMAVPAMNQIVSNARQTGALNDLVSSMHIARSTAITTNTRVTICASASGADCDTGSTWNQGWIVFSDRDSDQDVDSDETIIASSTDVTGLSIKSGQFSQFLMYRPNGRAMNASVSSNFGEFTLCDDRGVEHAKVLIVDLSGRPRTAKTLANGNAPVCS